MLHCLKGSFGSVHVHVGIFRVLHYPPPTKLGKFLISSKIGSLEGGFRSSDERSGHAKKKVKFE
jgi:hypothetical protein